MILPHPLYLFSKDLATSKSTRLNTGCLVGSRSCLQVMRSSISNGTCTFPISVTTSAMVMLVT